jgi:hypothetical protein
MLLLLCGYILIFKTTCIDAICGDGTEKVELPIGSAFPCKTFVQLSWVLSQGPMTQGSTKLRSCPMQDYSPEQCPRQQYSDRVIEEIVAY